MARDEFTRLADVADAITSGFALDHEVDSELRALDGFEERRPVDFARAGELAPSQMMMMTV